jgi:hypothetical protein
MRKKKRPSHSAAAKGRAKSTALGVYSEREREIFRYCGGCAKGPKRCPGCRARDPFAIVDGVMSIPDFDMDTDVKLAQTPGIPYRDQHAAFRRLLNAALAGFDVKLYDEKTERGLTADEAIQLWVRFVEWKDDLKKKPDAMPSSPSATGSPASDGCPTNGIAASTSTAPRSAPTVPPPPLPASPSPLVPSPEMISSGT